MTFDVFASILRPQDRGAYVVIVSAFPTDPSQPIGNQPHATDLAETIEEAQVVRDALIASITSALRKRGDEARRIVIRQ